MIGAFTFDTQWLMPMPLSCSLGPVGEFIFWMLLPPALFIVFTIPLAVKTFIKRRRGSRRSLLARQQTYLTSKCFFWISYLSYGAITAMILQHLPLSGAAFDCAFQEAVGCRLRKDYRLEIGDPSYTRIVAPVAVASAGIYVIGVPVAYFLMLWRCRAALNPQSSGVEQLRDRATLAKLTGAIAWKPLYEPFKLEFWYFEVVNLLRQAWVVGAVAALGSTPNKFIYFSIYGTIFYILILSFLRPYAYEGDTWAQMFCAVAQLIVFTSQAAVQNASSATEAESLGILNVASFAVLFCLFLASTVVEARDGWQEWARIIKDRTVSKRISFRGRILEQEGVRCVGSFPGKRAEKWDQATDAMQISLACTFLTDAESGLGKHAPDPDDPSQCWCTRIYGQVDSSKFIAILSESTTEDQETYQAKRAFAVADAKAMGQVLLIKRDYDSAQAWQNAQHVAMREAHERCRACGYKAPWGCQWFQLWTENIELARNLGQVIEVYYLEGKVGLGKVAWGDLTNKDVLSRAQEQEALGALANV